MLAYQIALLRILFLNSDSIRKIVLNKDYFMQLIKTISYVIIICEKNN